MTRYKVFAPNPSYSGEVATLVFRAGKADAVSPADQVALDYCHRRGYDVVAVDGDGEPLPAEDQLAAADDTEPVTEFTGDGVESVDEHGRVDEDVDDVEVVDDGLGVVVDTPTRPADYAQKGDWVAYAVSKGASREDAQTATKNELIELYG